MSHSYKIIIETNEGQQVVVADGIAKDPESIIDLLLVAGKHQINRNINLWYCWQTKK